MKLGMSFKDYSPKAIPSGVYQCEVSEVREPRIVGDSDVVDVRWKILEGTPQEAVGRTFNDSYFLTEDSIWRVLLLFQAALGLSKADLPDLHTTEEIVEFMQTNLPGMRANLVVELVVKDGTERTRVKRISQVK